MNQSFNRKTFDGEAEGRVEARTTITHSASSLTRSSNCPFSPLLGLLAPNVSLIAGRGKQASARPPATVAVGPPALSSVSRFVLLSNQWVSVVLNNKPKGFHFDFPLIPVRSAMLVNVFASFWNFLNKQLCFYVLLQFVWGLGMFQK